MKIVQISDLHLVPPGQRLHGLDPEERLLRAVAAVNRHHSDAEFCIITGDLADAGEPEAYRTLKRHLQLLEMPVHLMIGNHDNRRNFVAEFPDAARDQAGFVQNAFKQDDNAFILLDTVCQGASWGEFCEARAAWLSDQLARLEGMAIHIFMHHPPFDIGFPRLDDIRIRDTGPFDRSLGGPGGIRQLFFGHVHRPVTGSCRGISFSAIPGLNHQVKLDLLGQDRIRYCHEPPMIGVILVGREQTVLHYDHLLDSELVG